MSFHVSVSIHFISMVLVEQGPSLDKTKCGVCTSLWLFFSEKHCLGCTAVTLNYVVWPYGSLGGLFCKVGIVVAVC